MTPEQIRIACAEVEGWKRKPWSIDCWQEPNGGTTFSPGSEHFPDYLDDLNAAFRLVEVLREKGYIWEIFEQCDSKWQATCEDITTMFIAQNASLPHAICEAALKTLGIWKE